MFSMVVNIGGSLCSAGKSSPAQVPKSKFSALLLRLKELLPVSNFTKSLD